jgi:Domain of unknown function (DUF4375)
MDGAAEPFNKGEHHVIADALTRHIKQVRSWDEQLKNQAIKKIRLTRAEVEKAEYLKWNAFVHLVLSPIEGLTEVQRKAHLVLWYQSEVNNGGHYQYFVNSHGVLCKEAAGALRDLGVGEAAAVLDEAISRWTRRYGRKPETKKQFIRGALRGTYDDLDKRFGALDRALSAALEDYLKRYESDFVEIVE